MEPNHHDVRKPKRPRGKVPLKLVSFVSHVGKPYDAM